MGINYRLYYAPNIEGGYNNDVYKQLQYLKKRKFDGAAYKMQNLFPEGLMFYDCLYGLAWADFISELKPGTKIYDEGIIEIESCLTEIDTDFSKSIFPTSTKLVRGAYFTGWSNYLLGRKLEIIPADERDLEEVRTFKNDCNRIAKALEHSKTPYLESYHNYCWPADMTLCIASLSLHDRIFSNKFDAVCNDWIAQVKLRLDKNGLIPHSVEPIFGTPLEHSRGSSQSLILSFLPEIDSSFADEQYKIFKKTFVQSRLGLKCIGEYPIGTKGTGDIDSGPVIWGVGTAATIVSQRAITVNKDYSFAQEINNGIEALGFPTNSTDSKKFIGGYLDIGDVFIAWTRSIETPKVETSWWQLYFHLWSLVIIIPFLLLLLKLWKSSVKKFLL